jgi:hypothetical protein
MSKSSLRKDVSDHTLKSGKRASLVRAPILGEYRIGMKFLQEAKGPKPQIIWVAAGIAHLNPVCVATFMLAKLLPTAKAIRTEVDPIPYSTRGICALDSNGMGEID